MVHWVGLQPPLQGAQIQSLGQRAMILQAMQRGQKKKQKQKKQTLSVSLLTNQLGIICLRAVKMNEN